MNYVSSITVKVEGYDNIFSISKNGYINDSEKDDIPFDISIKSSAFLGALLAGGIEKAEKFFPDVKILEIKIMDHTTQSYTFSINKGEIIYIQNLYNNSNSILREKAKYVGAVLVSGEKKMQEI